MISASANTLCTTEIECIQVITSSSGLSTTGCMLDLDIWLPNLNTSNWLLNSGNCKVA